MILNPKIEGKLNELSDKLSKEEISVCKVILFMIENDISPEGYLSDDSGWKKSFNALILSRLIERDYHSDKGLILIEPLYIKEVDNVSKLNAGNIRHFIKEILNQYRFIFSKNKEGKVGLKSGAMGDANAIIDKMVRWFKKTGFQYSWEDVLRTAEYYIDQERKNNNYQYLQRADYFIEKDRISRLSSLIDEAKHFKPIEKLRI